MGLQVAVEIRKLRIAVSRLPRVDLKQQQVLAIESDLDRVEIGKRSDKQSRPNQKQQGDRDLSGDQKPARGCRRGMPDIVLQPGRDVHSRGLNRRGQPEQNSSEEGEPGGHGQHVPVQLRTQREIPAAIGQQQRKKADAPKCERSAKQPAEGS